MQRIMLNVPNPVILGQMLGPDPAPRTEIVAELYLPRERGPAMPAVVIAEGLGGIQDGREREYARMLNAEGYAVLIPDSFGSRGVGRNGDLIRALSVTEAMMMADNFAALDYLAGRQDVDASRVAIIGFSYGGMITQLAAYEQLAQIYLPDGPRFATHVAYYGCSIPRLEDSTTTGAPVTMLLGGRDRNVNIPRSQEIAEDLRRGGSATELICFDDIYHQWDGTDEKLRWVFASLRNLHFRLGRDNVVRDERSRLAMRGRTSRTAMIGRSADWRGYHILADAETTARSNDILMARLQAMGAANVSYLSRHRGWAGRPLAS